jgi:hypothetical protein
VPLFNYEDHDLFNVSWHWGTLPTVAALVTVGATLSVWGSYAGYNPRHLTHDTGLVSYTDVGGAGPNGIPGGVATSYECLSAYPPTGVMFPSAVGYTQHVTCHFMVKKWCLDTDPRFHRDGTAGTGSTQWSLLIGYSNIRMGCYIALPAPVWANGCYFGYCTQFPALFPNANYYACCNATGVIGGMYVLDTGIPVVSLTPHKFNIVMQRHNARFYIDNVLVATITDVAAGTSWLVNGVMYPMISCANLHVGGKYLDMEFAFPVISGSDYVPIV